MVDRHLGRVDHLIRQPVAAEQHLAFCGEETTCNCPRIVFKVTSTKTSGHFTIWGIQGPTFGSGSWGWDFPADSGKMITVCPYRLTPGCRSTQKNNVFSSTEAPGTTCNTLVHTTGSYYIPGNTYTALKWKKTTTAANHAWSNVKYQTTTNFDQSGSFLMSANAYKVNYRKYCANGTMQKNLLSYYRYIRKTEIVQVKEPFWIPATYRSSRLYRKWSKYPLTIYGPVTGTTTSTPNTAFGGRLVGGALPTYSSFYLRDQLFGSYTITEGADTTTVTWRRKSAVSGSPWYAYWTNVRNPVSPTPYYYIYG